MHFRMWSGRAEWIAAITPSPCCSERRPSIGKHLKRPQVNFRLPQMFYLGHYRARQYGIMGRSMSLCKSVTPSSK